VCGRNKSKGSKENKEPRYGKEDKLATRQKRMISVIIPYLAYMPYKEQIHKTYAGLKRQTAELEILVVEQPIVEKHTKIRKGMLHNRGLAQSSGDIIFHCDADAIFNDKTLLARMEYKLRNCDVIYPMFWSVTHKMNKLADGFPFARREVFEEFGPKDETDFGISLESFKILHWMYYNKRFHCSDEFVFNLNLEPFVKFKNKVDKRTRESCLPFATEVVNDLKGDGLWPKAKRSV
jgi:hypothetical protein